MRLTFLEIVQRAYRDAGLTGTPPVSVQNQTGRAGDVVRWVGDAFEAVQTRRNDWDHDWAVETFSLTAGQDTYDPEVDWGVVGGVRRFPRNGGYAWRPASGIASRIWLSYVEWEVARNLTVPPVSGQPVAFSIRPDGKVYFYPVPQEAYSFQAEYIRQPQVLAADDDVPRIPERFHMAIVHKAVMLACDHIRDWAKFDRAEEKYEELMGPMEREASQPYLTGGPLA